MFSSNSVSCDLLRARLGPLLAVILTILCLALATNGQTTTTSVTDGRTPSGLQPGSPVGSYPLSGFDNVNLYNGNLNFRLPLLQVGGRGSAQMRMMLALNLKSWRIKTTHREMPDGNEIHSYVPTQTGWLPYSGYSAGRLDGRNYGLHTSSNLTCRWYSTTLSRLTFSGADGTEYELRDQLTNGQPLSSTCLQGASRGTVFITADGSAATFISDTPISDNPTINTAGPHNFSVSGVLKLRDGSQYRIDNSNVTWIRDRNGNKLTFTYSTNSMTITDSLNRQVTVNYDVSDVAPYGLCDQIIYKGFGGAQRILRVSHTNLGNALRPNSGYVLRTLGGPTGLFPESTGSSSTYHDPTVTSAVWLPDGRGYKFFYNSYGELARVELPTGGAYEYDMTPGSGVICPGSCTLEDGREIYRRVVERRVYSNGGTGSTFDHRQVYTNTESLGSSTATVSVEQLSPTGTVLTRSRHYFASSALDSLFVGDVAQPYGAWYEGNETQTEILATTGAISTATVLRRTTTTRAQRAPVSWWASYVSSHPSLINKEPPNDSRVTEVVNTLEPATSNLVSKQAFGYDDSVPFNNQNNVKEYGFGTGSHGGLVRETRTTYLTSSTYTGTNVHLRTLPIQVSVYDGGGIERARSTIEYDNHNNDSSHAALVDRSNISGFDAAFTTAYTTRGNSTGSTSYLLVNGSVTGSISAYSQNDIAGNVVKTIDARGNPTSIIYTDCFGTPNGEAQTSIDPLELGSITKTFAFPTETRNSLNQSAFAQFDYYLGQPVDAKDVNEVVASAYFIDSLDRPTTIRRAVGTSLENRTIFAYDDTNRIITTTNDRDLKDDGILVSKLIYDQMGRTIEVRQYEGGTNYSATQTQYDALGRAFKTSNPFRPWQSESVIWTTQAFDALGRVVSVTTPDNAVLTSSYNGNSITVTDQAGKQRKSVTDALGRLVQVYEAPNDANFNYLTTYAYDALDNLTTVTQGSQTPRTFAYDSLKRLTSATNPESGTITYQYDANGNLIVKTDPRVDPVDSTRTVNSHFAYDALNRVTRRWYNGSNSVSANTHNSPVLPSGVGGTNEARFYYDSQSLPAGAPSYSRGAAAGRLVAQTYGAGSNGDYYAYDELGRPTLKIQQTGLLNFQLSAAYNLSGATTSYVYPSGHTISNSYDAAGRLITFSGNLGDGTTRTYANEISYSSLGSLAKEKFGTSTPIYHKLVYNSRGQLFDMRVSSVNDTWDWNRGRLILYYSSNHLWGQSGSDNNGNVLFAQTWIPPENATLDQADTVIEDSYTYDSLNRLTSVAEQRMTAAGGWAWSQQFQQSYNYDRWGNRTINPASWGTGINVKQFTVIPANNRLGVPVGQTGTMSYDAAGNLTNDTYTGAGNRTYDAENKITSAWGGNNQAQLYGYDASGQRIKRTVNGVETWQVYGLGGELVAEYAATGSPGNPQKEYGYRNGQLLITASLAGSDHSLSTNGTSAYVQGPSSSSLSITGAITVEAWIKIDSIGAYRTIISKEAFQQTGTGGGYRLAITDLGKVRLDLFQTHNTYTTAIGTATVTAGVWQHVAGVFDGSQMRIYLNGVLNGTVSTTNAPATGSGNFYLGRFSYSLNPYYFNGLIDEARVSNAAPIRATSRQRTV